MGFLQDIFGKIRDDEWVKQAEFENWNDIVYTRKEMDMDDPVQRREYIGSCLQQMEEAAKELDALEFQMDGAFHIQGHSVAWLGEGELALLFVVVQLNIADVDFVLEFRLGSLPVTVGVAGGGDGGELLPLFAAVKVDDFGPF